MDELVVYMKKEGILKTPRIIDAFLAVDRKDFVPESSKHMAHLDQPLHIGYEQTISQPSTVAFMLELLQPERGDTVLDIGSGSGWTTALLAHIVGDEGAVIGVERIPELVAFGNANIEKYHFPNAHIERAGPELGIPQHEPFDRILISASASTFPHEILSQVREGGVIVLPVRNAIWRARRFEHQPLIDKYDGFVFVPLILD